MGYPALPTSKRAATGYKYVSKIKGQCMPYQVKVDMAGYQPFIDYTATAEEGALRVARYLDLRECKKRKAPSRAQDKKPQRDRGGPSNKVRAAGIDDQSRPALEEAVFSASCMLDKSGHRWPEHDDNDDDDYNDDDDNDDYNDDHNDDYSEYDDEYYQ